MSLKSYSNNQEVKRAIQQNVEKHGCHISLIKSDGYNPSFAYTVGLTKQYNHPEVLVLGLSVESAHSILNSVLSDIKEGAKFITKVDYNGFLDGFDVQFVNVREEYYPDYLGYAGWFNENSWNFKALQMVWPDIQSNFPWNIGFSKKLEFTQPLLDRNTDFKFLEPRNLSVFTTEDIIKGGDVTKVYHNKDGDWQFHSDREARVNYAKIISLEELVKLDSTLNDIYYLNYGESAYREDKTSGWIIDSEPIRKIISDSLE